MTTQSSGGNAPIESQGPATVVDAVTAGSLSASDWKALGRTMANKAADFLNESKAASFQRRDADARRLEQIAEAYIDCCRELQAAVESAMKRQPEENIGSQTQPPTTNQL